MDAPGHAGAIGTKTPAQAPCLDRCVRVASSLTGAFDPDTSDGFFLVCEAFAIRRPPGYCGRRLPKLVRVAHICELAPEEQLDDLCPTEL